MKSLRLLPLSVLFLILFNEPVISIVNRPILIGGIPLLYIYVTCIWLLLIGAVAYILHLSNQTDDSLNTDE